MGWLEIPDPVQGKTVVSGELNLAELEETVRCLKAALSSCTQANVAAGLRNHDASCAPSGRLPHAQLAVSEQPLSKSTTAASFDPQALMLEKLQSGMRKASTDAASRAVHQPTGQQSRAKWTEKWRTEAEDHNNEAAQCMAFAPLFDGLPGGDGHGGWLISSSKNLLNLWECNVGRGEPALQLMHSQATEYRMADVALERGTQMLLGVARETARTKAECVALHSLNPEEGMFAPKGWLPLPPPSHTDTSIQGNPLDHPNARQAESLHALGGPMKGCVAASYKDLVSIYPTLVVTPSTQPKTTWQAHDGFVSQLHRSGFSIDLFSAAVDGSVHRWDLKSKPKAKQPAAGLQGLTAEVTGLQQVSDKHLLAGSAEGLVAVWDLRRIDTPMFMIPAPDSSGVTNVAASPETRLAAFSTARASIFALTLELESSRGFVPSEVTARPLAAPVKSLAWNTRTQLLMAAVGPSIHVYCKSA